jgi:mRNA-degrading endonuclease RelE of RelBE toxin-antitoxin system
VPVPQTLRVRMSTPPARRISDFDIPFDLMSGVAVPLCSDLVRLAALKQYQGEGGGEDEHTPALLLEAPYRVGKPLRDKPAGFHSARLGTHWRILYRIDESKRVVVVQDIQHRSNPYRRR